MTRSVLRWLLLLATGCCPVAMTAQESGGTALRPTDAGTHFAAGTEAFARADFATATEEFRAAIEGGSEGPSAYYNLAVSQYRLGDYASAEAAFRDLGRRFPAMQALADYNLGLALLRQNRPEAAREALLEAALGDDETVSVLALAMLGRLPEPAPPARSARWTRLIELGAGHDDNVQLIDPIALPTGASTESPFVELSLFAGGPVGKDEIWRLAASAYLLEFSDAPDYDQHLVQLGASRESRTGDWLIALRPRLSLSYIGGDGFERNVGTAVEFGRRIGASGGRIEFELAYDSASEIDPAFAYVDGDRFELALRHERRLRDSALALEYRSSNDDRDGAGVSADRDRYLLSWRRALSPAWSADFLLAYRHSVYERLQPAREEDRSRAGLRAMRMLGADWQLSLSYSYSNNDSSDAIYEYRRNRFAIGASRQFQ